MKNESEKIVYSNFDYNFLDEMCRPIGGNFNAEYVDPDLCTHINYAFAKLNNDQLELYEWNDKEMYSRVMKLKEQNLDLKILISVGGFTVGSAPFSKLVNDPILRENFVTMANNFLVKYGFDGLDLDWEYPQGADKSLFTALLRELRSSFSKNGFLLTAAVPASKDAIDNGYEIDLIAKELDWINLMAYDFHGAWNNYTGHNAPLYEPKDNAGTYYTVDFVVNYWLKKGMPSNKIILGLASYGRSFKLLDQTKYKRGDGAKGAGSPGFFTGEGGILSYYEICLKISEGAQKFWDDESKMPYAYLNDEWYSFDETRSLKQKIDYLKAKKLGGAMIWSLDFDDFNGTYCNQGKYPLVSFVKNQLSSAMSKTSSSLLMIILILAILFF